MPFQESEDQILRQGVTFSITEITQITEVTETKIMC